MTRSRGEPSGPGVDYRRGMASGAALLPHTREAWPGPTWDDGVGHCDPIGAWRSGGPVNTLNAVSNRSRAVHPGGPTGALVIRPARSFYHGGSRAVPSLSPTRFGAAGLSRSPGAVLRRPKHMHVTPTLARIAVTGNVRVAWPAGGHAASLVRSANGFGNRLVRRGEPTARHLFGDEELQVWREMDSQ
jgi:hypothetical protein